MQPPPRKGNYAKFLKNLHAEQVAKLQLKNQNECELLEDIRNFILKRSAIEKSYADALLKISSAFLNRKIPNIPDIKTEGSEEKWNMWNVWRTVLEENEKLARARLAAVEVFSSHVADDAKFLRANKLANAKRCLDQLAQVQKEVQTSVLDVDKTKKAYFDEEHSAHDVRDKARDIEEKLKKKKGSFFQSITSLQKNSAKVTTKREQLEEKSSGARNDYLLSLAAANAHQTRYFVVDFQNTIMSLESCVYDKVAEYLMLIARTELLTCTATQTSFNRIKEQSGQLSREYNLQCVYLYYPVLKQHIHYDFEPCDNDTVIKVTAEHSSSASALTKEAKRWATKIGRESANVKEAMSKLQNLHALRESGQKTDPNDPNGPDIDTKMDELRQAVRRAETSKVKAEARIECLKNGGVNVDEFLQEIENLSVHDLPRSSSSMSVRTDASGLGGTPAYFTRNRAKVLAVQNVEEIPPPPDSEITIPGPLGERESTRRELEYSGGSDEDYLEDRSVDSLEVTDTSANTQLKSVIADVDLMKNTPNQEPGGSDSMYDSDYNDGGSESAGPTSLEEKERPDSAEVDGEWAMLEQERQRIEQLTAGWDDPTQVDWGAEGGETTAEISKPPPDETGIAYKCTALYTYTAQNPDELSIVENEQLEVVGEGDGDGWLRARNYKGEEGYVPHNYLDVEREEPYSAGKEGPQLTSQISFSSVDYTVDEEPSEQSAGQETIKEAYRPPDLDLSGGGEVWCVALYDYEATCPEELSFYEGDIIKILRKVVHDEVDDGWWEGQKEDEVGLFPSLVVEECRENGEPLTPECDDTPPGSAPPVFTPPEVPTFMLAPQSVIITQATPLVEAKPILITEEEAEEGTSEDPLGNFSMELSGGQRKHYDKQFGEVQISVCVTEEENDANVEDEDKSGDPDFGLASCSVVITAATPMIEEAEKPFPPPEEEAEGEPTSEPPDKETTEVPPPYTQKVKVYFQEERKRIEKRKEDPYETDSDVVKVPEEVGVETRKGTRSEGKKKRKRRKKSPSPARSNPNPPAQPTHHSIPTKNQVSGGGGSGSVGGSVGGEKDEEEQPADSAPFPPSSSTGSEEDTYTGPSTADNSQSDKRKHDIPDELEPHQLARLQDLKESDA